MTEKKDIDKGTAQVSPNLGLSGNNENGKEDHIDDTSNSPKQDDKSFHNTSDSSVNSTVSVLNTYDFVVSCKLNADLLAVKTEFNKIIKCIGLSDDEEPGSYTNEQINNCVKKVLKPQLVDYLSNILCSVQSICLPEFTVGKLPVKKPSDIDVDSLNTFVSAKLDELNNVNQISLDRIQGELNTLSASINNYKFRPNISGDVSTPIRPQSKKQNIVHEHDEVHVEDVAENFLSADECSELLELLPKYNFIEKNGHSVFTFGEPYRYTGSANNQQRTDFPSKIKVILDKLNSSDDAGAPLTSCLVNRYVGPDSFLPEHSDDERSIDPNSKIYTISLGCKRTVQFTENNTDKKFMHVPNPGSMYTMTRKSQHYYQHNIDPDTDLKATDVRYSLTFRSINWRNRNSTLLIGDSNSAKLQFGSGLGKFGASLPGNKVWAPTLDDINPYDCIGFSNVVILCGVNDIKSRYVTSKDDIKMIYDKLACKVKQIQSICKGIKIVVCPLLPTKLHDLNRKAIHFNSFIFSDLVINNYGIRYIWGLNSLLDNSGVLRSELGKDNDYLHLGNMGARVLGKLIKRHFFPSTNHSNTPWKSSGAQNEGGDGAR